MVETFRTVDGRVLRVVGLPPYAPGMPPPEWPWSAAREMDITILIERLNARPIEGPTRKRPRPQRWPSH